MSDTERDVITPWAVFKPSMDKVEGLGRVLQGAGLLLLSRFHDNLSMASLVERHAARHPDRDAITFETQRLTYGEFNAAANRYAHALKAAGIGSGDAVAVLLDNRPQTLMLVVALAKLGASTAMCNTKQRGEVLAHSLGTVQPRGILVGAELVAAFDDIRDTRTAAELEHIWFVGDGPNDGAPDGYTDLDNDARCRSSANPAGTKTVSSEQNCFYIFTSGTTGMPKASRMSHRRWVRAGAGLGLAGLRLRSDDRFYCPLPLYHNNALTVCWGAVLCAGATLVLARKFSVSGFWPDVRRHQATVFCYIGELCRYLLQAEPHDNDRNHCVRAAIGNGLRPDIWDEFKQRFGIERICEFYGASEGNTVFVNGLNMDRTAGLCPMPFTVVAYDTDTEQPLTNARGGMAEVGKGEVGLLLTKVTNFAPFEGYTDPEAGEKKLFRNVFARDDCYFNTGDLVRLQGMRHIAFIDRLGDTFRWKGENVATTQVENALNASDQIDEAVVYGVTVPKADGRAGMAAITPAGALADIDWARLVTHLRRELPGYAVPVFIRPRPEQEVTGTMKYRKVDLKKDGYAPASDDPVYVLRSGADRYERIDDDLRARLDAGELSL